MSETARLRLTIISANRGLAARGGGFDLDVDASRQAQFVERVDRLVGRLHDVDESLVRADLELFSGLLVDVRASEDRVAFDPRRQRDGAMNDRFGALRRVDDVFRGLVEDGVIVRFHSDADTFVTNSGHNKIL